MRESDTVLKREGLVATTSEYGWQLMTGGSPMIAGRHYWEVHFRVGGCLDMVGAVRPGLDHDQYHGNSNDAYLIWGHNGALLGKGKGSQSKDPQGDFTTDDRVGVLLDLDAGWMRFYRNGKRCGPGFTEGVTGPLVRAVQIQTAGDRVAVLPGAVAPEGHRRTVGGTGL